MERSRSELPRFVPAPTEKVTRSDFAGEQVVRAAALSCVGTMLGSLVAAIGFALVMNGIPRRLGDATSFLHLWIVATLLASALALPAGTSVIALASRTMRMRPLAAAVIYGSVGAAVASIVGLLLGHDGAMKPMIASWAAVWGGSIGLAHASIVRSLQLKRVNWLERLPM